MQKINFQDLPSTTTPLNANNLNQLQTNVENEFAKNIKLIYTKDIAGNTTDTYNFPTTTSLYLVIAHQNGNQNYCIFDIVYGRGQYYTRIKDTATSSTSITITYSSNQISCSCLYGTKLAILEIPFVE